MGPMSLGGLHVEGARHSCLPESFVFFVRIRALHQFRVGVIACARVGATVQFEQVWVMIGALNAPSSPENSLVWRKQ